jgi:hypothetical protein
MARRQTALRNNPNAERYNGNGQPLNNSMVGNVNSPLPDVQSSGRGDNRGAASTQPNYDFVHPEYAQAMPLWERTRAAVEGQPALDRHPDPTPLDDCEESRSRYVGYCARAVYFNATGRTKAGLVGIALGEWPSLTVPTSMEYLKDDADGAGLNIYALSQHVIGENLEVGRGGLFVDYPTKPEGDGTSIAEQRQGTVARIVFYKAEDIRDWSFEKVGTDLKLSYLKLYECRDRRTPDGWSMEAVESYRILRLRDGVYTVEVFEKGQGGYVSMGEVTPRDASGSTWNEIPFQWVGPETNQAKPQKPPLYDLAQVNLGHYRNSADFEESVFMLGQPQVTMTGLDQQWRDHLEESGVYFGSRRVLMGPVGSSIGLLQVQPNTLAQSAMKDKKEEMVALGARLLQPGSATKTAEQSKSETRASYSVLSLVCDNVSQAIKRALVWVQKYMGASGEVDFGIDTDFDGLSFNSEIVNTIIKAVQAGILPESEAWRALRQLNLIDPEKTDEELREEIDAASEAAMQMQAALGLSPGTGAPNPAQPEPPAPDDE